MCKTPQQMKKGCAEKTAAAEMTEAQINLSYI